MLSNTSKSGPVPGGDGAQILLACQNTQEAEALLPIAEKLRDSEDKIIVDFLSQDDVYAQGVTEFLKGEGEDPHSLGLPFKMKSPYTTESHHLKILLYWSLNSSLSKFAEKYDAIVSGVDGLPIRILAQHARNTSTSMFQLIVSSHDSVSGNSVDLSMKFRKVGKKISRYILRFAMGLDFLTYPNYRGGSHSGTIFTPGEMTKDSLIRAGVESSRIHVTGNPRFKPLFSKEQAASRINEGGNIELLYLPSAFKMHGYEKHQKAQMDQIERIASWVSHQEGFILNIKPHPRENQAQYESVGKNNNVSILECDYNIYEAIQRSDIVTTIVSTAAYESALLRRPVIIGLFPRPGLFERNWNIITQFPSAHSPEEYADQLSSITSSQKAYNDTVREQVQTAHQMIDPATPSSDEKIANKILEEISCSKK